MGPITVAHLKAANDLPIRDFSLPQLLLLLVQVVYLVGWPRTSTLRSLNIGQSTLLRLWLLRLSIQYQNWAGEYQEAQVVHLGTKHNLPSPHCVIGASPPLSNRIHHSCQGGQLAVLLSCFLTLEDWSDWVQPSSLHFNGTLALSLGANVSTLGTRTFKSIGTRVLKTKSKSPGTMVDGTTPTYPHWLWILVLYLLWANTM